MSLLIVMDEGDVQVCFGVGTVNNWVEMGRVWLGIEKREAIPSICGIGSESNPIICELFQARNRILQKPSLDSLDSVIKRF